MSLIILKDYPKFSYSFVFKISNIEKYYGREEVINAQDYVIDADVALLCGKNTIEQWGSKLDTVNFKKHRPL